MKWVSLWHGAMAVMVGVEDGQLWPLCRFGRAHVPQQYSDRLWYLNWGAQRVPRKLSWHHYTTGWLHGFIASLPNPVHSLVSPSQPTVFLCHHVDLPIGAFVGHLNVHVCYHLIATLHSVNILWLNLRSTCKELETNTSPLTFLLPLECHSDN